MRLNAPCRKLYCKNPWSAHQRNYNRNCRLWCCRWKPQFAIRRALVITSQRILWDVVLYGVMNLGMQSVSHWKSTKLKSWCSRTIMSRIWYIFCMKIVVECNSIIRFISRFGFFHLYLRQKTWSLLNVELHCFWWKRNFSCANIIANLIWLWPLIQYHPWAFLCMVHLSSMFPVLETVYKADIKAFLIEQVSLWQITTMTSFLSIHGVYSLQFWVYQMPLNPQVFFTFYQLLCPTNIQLSKQKMFLVYYSTFMSSP